MNKRAIKKPKKHGFERKRSEWFQVFKSMFVNKAKGDQKGVNLAFFKNVAQFSQVGINISSYNLVHITGLSYLLRIGDSLDSVQKGMNIAAIGNYVDGHQKGFNFAVFRNSVEFDQIGVNVSLSNSAMDQVGVNIALINKSGRIISPGGDSEQKWLNIALLNSAHIQRGVSLALWNWARGQFGLNFGVYNLTGAQSGVNAALVNSVIYESNGVSVSALHATEDAAGAVFSLRTRIYGILKGFAAGIVSHSRQAFGLMAGLVTVLDESKESRAIQLGLINIRRDQERWYNRIRPFISISW